MPPLLTLRGLAKSYDGNAVLTGTSGVQAWTTQAVTAGFLSCLASARDGPWYLLKVFSQKSENV